MSVDTSTTKNTALKIVLLPETPAERAKVESTIGTAPRRPAHDKNACSRQAYRNGASERATASGRARKTRIAVRARADQATAPSWLGKTSSPRTTKRTTCARNA